MTDILPRQITHEGIVLEHHIREGRFQRSLSLITAFSSLLVFNIVMGPPLLAPILFATSGFLGLIASMLRSDQNRDRPSYVSLR